MAPNTRTRPKKKVVPVVRDDGEDNEAWYVIETQSDFCIVEENSILFDTEISIGDTVSFFWSKSQKLDGIIRFKSDDSDTCVAEAEKMKLAKKERSPSFHADEPRKAALKFKANLKSVTASSSSSSSGKAHPKKKKLEEVKLKKQQEKTYERLLKNAKKDEEPETDDDDDVKEDDDDDDNDDTELLSNKTSCDGEEENGSTDSELDEDKKLLKDLASKLASNIDIKMLRELAKMPIGASLLGKKPKVSVLEKIPKSDGSKSLSPPSDKPSSSSSKMEQSNRIGDSVASSKRKNQQEEHLNEEPVLVKKLKKPQPANNVKKPAPLHKVHGVANSFKGQMFKDLESRESIEVFPNSNIYCDEDTYAWADSASSTTMVARRLIEGVFSAEALSQCSVSGLPPRGKGKGNYSEEDVKPYLCPRAINAIVCLALKWQKEKHFQKKKDDTTVRSAIAVRLNEIQRAAAAGEKPKGDTDMGDDVNN